VLAFFWPLVTPDRARREYFVPGDFWLQVLPFHTFAAHQLAVGKLALWDPYMFSGHPFQADIQTAVTYPIAAANEWLGGSGFGYLALEWEAVVHFGLAATFTFLLVELLTGSVAAGLLGGVVFGFGGFLTSYPSQQLPVLESTVWLPLELYCLERAVRAGFQRRAKECGATAKGNLLDRVRWMAAAGACAGLAVLAGHPQTVLYLAYIGAAYFLFRLSWRAWWQALWAVVPAAGLAAVQLLPSLQLFAVNHKGKLDFSFAAGGLQPGDLAALLLNQPNGGRILYVGLLPLALALAAIVLLRNRQVLFWGLVAVVGVLLSLGTDGPLFRLFFAYLPGWDLFRDQERAVVWFALAAAILAGYGLSAIARRLHRGLAVLLAIGVLAASFGNLLWANAGNNLTAAAPHLDAADALLQPVKADKDIFRVRISEESLGHNTGNLDALQFVSGDSPFELQSFKDWTEDQPAGNRVPEWQLLRLTNSHYVVSSRELCSPCTDSDGLRLLDSQAAPPDARILESQRGASPPARTLYLYQVLFSLPRAFFFTHAQPVLDERQAVQALNTPDFDAAQTLLLPPPVRASASTDNARLTADITGYAPGFVDVRTTSDRPAYLYVSEVSYPGWQATIDAQPAAVLLADGLFSALDVPPGDHHVVLQYVPKPFYAGAAISAATLLGLAILWASALIRKPVRASILLEPARAV
jgi:hypothetical protein